MEKPANNKEKGEQPKKPRRYPTVSAKLPTGQLVEMIYRPEERETAFILAASGETVEVKQVPSFDGGWLVPYSPRNNLLRHKVVLLPSATEEYQVEELLRALVRGFIRRYVDLSPEFEEIATHYVLFTWLYDDFNELPYLRVQGDYGSGKSRFLQTVGSLVYKPIFASGASSVSPLFRILDAVGGTLIIDEGDFRFSDEKAEIIKILNCGNTTGFPVLRSEQQPTGEYNPRAFTVFGPKLVATRGPFEDKALESRCITEIMTGKKVRGDIPKNLPPSFETEALSIRNKLLLHRFRHAGEERDLLAATPQNVEPRIAQVFTPLLATIPDEKARARIVALAGRKSREMARERSDSTEGRVLAVILELRERTAAAIHLKDIASAFTKKHGGLFGGAVSPQWIGALVRRLGFQPRKSHGTYAILPEDFSLLADLASRFGLSGGEGDEGDVGDSSEGGQIAV